VKRTVLRPRASQDLRKITAHYRKEGGSSLALRWTAALEEALRQLAEYPGVGSPRLASATGIEGLRTLTVSRFPYLIFYIEHVAQVDVLRVLHQRRDVPELMRDHAKRS
jgi:toxin ParE1/3/4